VKFFRGENHRSKVKRVFVVNTRHNYYPLKMAETYSPHMSYFFFLAAFFFAAFFAAMVKYLLKNLIPWDVDPNR